MNNFLKIYNRKKKKITKNEKEKIINEIENIDLVNTSSKEAFNLLYNFHCRLKNI